jgi:hypothetical protein
MVFQTVDSIDPNQTSPGAGVAKVPLTATGQHTGTIMTTTTDTNGNYSFGSLPADTYQVAVAIAKVPGNFWGFTAQSFSATVTVSDDQTFANLNFALTPQTSALVQNLYQRVLIRSADAGGLTAWANALQGGALNFGQEFLAFTNSPEFQTVVAPVATLLEGFFPGQPVDPDLLRHAVQLLHQGITPDAVVQDALYSQTFVNQFGDTSQLSDSQFVTFLYQQLLHRSPSSAELSSWVNLIAANSLDRGQVVLDFLPSSEFLTRNPAVPAQVAVSMAYLGMLGRPAEPAGFQGWVNFLLAGNSLTQLTSLFQTSPEFTSLHGFPDVLLSDVAAQPIKPAVNVLSRLQMYNPAIGHQTFDLPVAPGSISGTGANGKPVDLYVIAHGWAPGFLEDVLLHSTPGDPLKVWQTVQFPGGISPQGPDARWLFDGIDQVSVEGLAKAISAADPNAVVLAYSWIDQSGTAGGGSIDPTDPAPLLGAAQSESYTQLNGLQMAEAIKAALSPNFFADQGLIHLMGHSHGSKVATVAALALQVAGVPVTQLTTLESPESGPSPTITVDGIQFNVPPQHFAGLIDATNFLWYYMQQMNVNPNDNVVSTTSGTRAAVPAAQGQLPGQFPTYIDNYYSQAGFGEPLGGVQPLTAVFPNAQSLSPIADVNLHPEILYPLPTDFSSPTALSQAIQTIVGSHDYPPPWYAQASIDPPPPPNAPDGLAWSPLLNATPPSGGPGLYKQTWTQNVFNQQFILSASSQPPTFTPVAVPFQYADQYQVGAVSDNGTGTITLGAGTSANPLSLLATTFTPLANVSQGTNKSNLLGTGLSFKFQFANPAPGDRLVIWARGLLNLNVPAVPPFFNGLNSGTLGYQTVPLFTMTAQDAGTAAQFATISLDGFANQNSHNNNDFVEGMLNATQQPVLGFSLIHASGGQSSVTISSMQQFSDGTTL